MAKAYQAHGYHGTYLILADGRFADTVSGETSEDMEADKALKMLSKEVSRFVSDPPCGDRTASELAAYVGIIGYDDAITLAEAAQLYPLAYSTLAQYARTGRLRARQSGSTWLTTRRDIEDLIYTCPPLGSIHTPIDSKE